MILIRHKYIDAEIEFLRENSKGLTVKEITKKFNENFDCHINSVSIYGALKRYKMEFVKEYNYFKKGSIPWNKGEKLIGFKPTNGFKKGHKPSSYKNVGSEIINKDGFVQIKVSDPDIWKLKHHIIYENFYKVKIKPGEKLIFIDGDKRNFDITNLMLLSNSEQIAYRKFQNLKECDTEIIKTYIQLAKLNSKIRRLKRL